MNRKELIKKYLEFFKSKDHKVVPSASLVPENDPTTLFVSAGMQPLVPYLLGQKHPLGKRIVDVQKCIRTTDIEEVGDTTHHTFFEMLGNWSLGDYFKKEAIEYSFEFLTKTLKIPKEKLAITIFAGEKNMAPADFESKEIWKDLGIKRIEPFGVEDNWWGPAGETGPCGPDTEMFYWKSSQKVPKEFNPNDSTLATNINSNWVEIWNDVLMQYVKDDKGNYKEAKQKNIDTGMGVERTVAILNGLEDNYEADMWKPIIKTIEKLSKKKYDSEENKRAMRIIADHIKAAVFIISDGVVPSNTDRGYILRRLIRRTVRYGKLLGKENFLTEVAKPVFKIYDDYPELKKNKKRILEELEKEENKFLERLEKGLKEIKKMSCERSIHKKISGKESFLLYQSYGFPIEMIKDVAIETGTEVDEKGFQKEFEKHQELSRTASKGKFKAGLADSSEKTTQYHTATHLLHEALKKVLGDHLEQKGSNITQERLRFDFKHDKKLTDEEKKEVEALVNKQIKRALPISMEEMPFKEAVKNRAHASFTEKYPPIVKVYTMGDFSKEVCTGPHVKNTNELGKFKIKKEESSSAGIRRIKAVLE